MSDSRADPPPASSSQPSVPAPTEPSPPQPEPQAAPAASANNVAEGLQGTAPLQALPAPVDNGTTSDASDSAYAGSEDGGSSYTASLTSSITSYRFEHGRRYHAYQDGRYDLPNDEKEQERLDLQYHALRLAFEDKLFFAPVPDRPAHILDVGTGTGIWVMDAADLYPDTQITGTDLSPIQPQWIPPNAKFEVDDAELPWTFPPDHFDLVHVRIMNAFLRDWDRFMEQAFRHIKPGGWIECQELSVEVLSDDDTLPPDSHIEGWALKEQEAWRKLGLSVLIDGEGLKVMMERAGFVNVQIRAFKLPIGTWPVEPKLREVGEFQLVAMLEGLQGLTIAPWVRHLGWKEAEVEVYIAKVKNEWKDRKIHTYFPLYSVYAQKPLV